MYFVFSRKYIGLRNEKENKITNESEIFLRGYKNIIYRKDRNRLS